MEKRRIDAGIDYLNQLSKCDIEKNIENAKSE